MNSCSLICTRTMSIDSNKKLKVIERSVLYIAAAKAYVVAANRLENFWMAPSKLLDLAILISKQQKFEFKEDSVADDMFCCIDERFFTLFYRAALTHVSNSEICDEISNDLSTSIYKAIVSDFYKAHS